MSFNCVCGVALQYLQPYCGQCGKAIDWSGVEQAEPTAYTGPPRASASTSSTQHDFVASVAPAVVEAQNAEKAPPSAGVAFLRNAAFALVSLIAIALSFWVVTQLFTLLVSFLLALDHVWFIVIIIAFGSVVLPLIQLLMTLLAIPYLFLSRLATNTTFIMAWSAGAALLSLISTSVLFWPSYVAMGAAGIIAGIVLTFELIVFGFTLVSHAAEGLELLP